MLVDGFDRAWGYAVSALNTAWDAVAFVGIGVADITTSQAGNPIMMGMAALGAAVWAWGSVPEILGNTILPGDDMGSRLTRGGLSLVAVALSALLAAGIVGSLRDDPPPVRQTAMNVSSTELPVSVSVHPKPDGRSVYS